jgi:hypothetical protein
MAGCEGQSGEICTDKGRVAEVRQIEHRQFLAQLDEDKDREENRRCREF